ncbi:MAG: TetR/AcrR family transcriptional regulator [Pseudomonadota bacterium]
MPDVSASRRKSPPKQARSIAKRNAILDAAERLIANHSPGSLGTQQIAAEAGIPIGSVYRYFTDIDDVLLSLFERINAGTVDTLRAHLADPASDWREDLDRTFKHLAAMHRDHPTYGVLMAHIDRADQDDDDIAALLDRLLARNAPHLDPGVARQVTRTIIAMLEGIERRLHHWPAEQRGPVLNEARLAIRAYLNHHIEGPDQ